jgi:hypothetical protein
VLTADDLIRGLGLREKRLCGRCIRDIAEFVDLATREAVESQARSEATGSETTGT